MGLDEEEQEHNYAAETIEIIEDKESNTQLKSPRESTDLSNNVEFSDNIFYETSWRKKWKSNWNEAQQKTHVR